METLGLSGISVSVLAAEVEDVVPGGADRWRVDLAGRDPLDADAVLLAVGNASSRKKCPKTSPGRKSPPNSSRTTPVSLEPAPRAPVAARRTSTPRHARIEGPGAIGR